MVTNVNSKLKTPAFAKVMAGKQNSKLRNKNRVYELTLGYSCNSNCQFCSIEPSKRNINKTTQEALNDILQARREGFRVIGFGGGEPTIRKDILNLVSFAKKLGFETIRIQTNGIMLCYKNFCKDLVLAGANFFKFSIHGHKPEIHDKLTRVPGSFKKSIAGLENIHSLEARTEVDIVINKLNYKFLPQIIEFFSISKGVSSFVIIYPLYRGRMKENSKTLGVKLTEVIPHLEEAIYLAWNLQLDKCLIMNVPFCAAKIKSAIELPKPMSKYFGENSPRKLNLKVNAPETIVEDADEDAIRGKIKIAKCKKCYFASFCDGVWKNYIEVFGTKEFE